MIGHEMILLGLLKESPKHGYEIKKKIREILSLFTGVDFKSVYYPLKIMEKKGLVVKRAAKQGKRPQRFIYELTSSGDARFDELLSKSFLNFKRPNFSLDLSLYFLQYMSPDIARRRLRARMRVLEKISYSLNQLINSLKKDRNVPSVRILEHNLQMVDTESKFLNRLVASL